MADSRSAPEALDSLSGTRRRVRDIRGLVALYSVWTYLVYLPFLAVSTAFFGTLAFLLAVARMPRIGNTMGVLWARANGFVAPMFVRVRGRENAVPGQSYVIVANHQSQFDIFALYGWLGRPFRWVMKSELRGVPFLGVSCYHLGHVFVDRSDKGAAWASIDAARDRIKGGLSIAFFPEGTRSDDGALLPFKNGAFRFAVDLGLPVLPVTLRGTRDALPNRTLAVFPGRADLIIHPPIPAPSSEDPDAIAKLAERARAAIESGLSRG